MVRDRVKAPPVPARAALVAAALAAALLAAPASAEDDEGWAPPAFADDAGVANVAVDGVPELLAIPVPLAPPEPEPPRLRERIVSAARELLGRPFRGDCSSFVLSLFRKAAVHAALPPARSRSESLYRGGEKVEAPEPGDLAFFHDTYDRNHDGRLNDRWTHVALVEKVEGELVWLLHRGIHGIERIRMDLANPSDRTTNDRLRIPKKNDPPGTRLLSGELFSGFAAVAPSPQR
jgi:hypothetical protein